MDATPEIVVTGRALERPAAEQPLDAVRVERQQLLASPVTGLDQVLQQVPGVQLFRRSDARSASPTSQGVTLRALGGNAASRAQLVLDGVPQTDPFGGWVYWPAYDPAVLSEVAVTRGGGSVAYGPGGLAGVIELTSDGADRLMAGVEIGSRSSLDGRLLANGRVGSGTITANLHGAKGVGFIPIAKASRGPADEPAPYENVAGRLRWAGQVADSTEFQASVSGFHDERSRGLDFSDNRSRGADASLRLVGRGSWQWVVLGYGQWRNFRSSFAATDDDRTTARRTSLQYDVPGQAYGWSAEVRPPVGDELELRLGTDGRLMRGRSLEFGSYVSGVPMRDRRSGGRSGTAGAFAEAAVRSGPWVASAGARLDRWWISDGFFTEEVLATGALVQDQRPAARSGWRPTGRAAVGRQLGSGLSVRGAAYLGWRLPTLNELFRPFRLGADATAANADLKPERLAGAEAGVRWQQDGIRLGLTGFWNRLADPIANVTVASGPGTFPGVGFVPAGGAYRQRRNLDAIRSAGLELDGEWRQGPWSLGVSGSRTWARVSASGAPASLDGLRPAQTPAWSATARASWMRDRSAAVLQLRYVGPQFEDDLNRLTLPGAVTFDAFGALPLAGRWQVTLRGENLLNKQVAAAITGDGVVERATPRTLWLGLRLTDQ